MRALLARDPKNLDLALRIAQLYMARARSESDPRFLGQAQAALAAWWSQSEPPVPVLLLRATIRQSNHDFKNSRLDLEQAVKREPNNAQAWLTLATVLQVTGDIKGAADSCNKLLPLTARLISTTCISAVDGARGQAAKAFDAINAALAEADTARGANIGVRTWALTLQAELAERLARNADADRLYRASLALDAVDAYTVAAYSDFLIDASRAREVLELIPATTRVDTLLLRRAIAAKIVVSPDAPQIAEDLARRFAASRARGDRIHLREEARFVLAVKNSPDEAVNIALDNWAVQKEPLDARIALEAAVAARQAKSTREVVQGVVSTQLQGEKLSQLVSEARAL
jgi:tetratricopeptide (TPR) repeat protein